MPRTGRPPIPTKLKLLHGETRSERINRREPKPVDGYPSMPAGMDPRSKRVWRRVREAWGPTRIIQKPDRDALRTYCDAVVSYERGIETLMASGLLLTGKDGQLVKNPLHQIVRDNAKLILLFAREFGLTPSARSSIRAPEHPAGVVEDPLDTWQRSG